MAMSSVPQERDAVVHQATVKCEDCSTEYVLRPGWILTCPQCKSQVGWPLSDIAQLKQLVIISREKAYCAMVFPKTAAVPTHAECKGCQLECNEVDEATDIACTQLDRLVSRDDENYIIWKSIPDIGRPDGLYILTKDGTAYRFERCENKCVGCEMDNMLLCNRLRIITEGQYDTCTIGSSYGRWRYVK